jgi:hypothetical protein
LILTDISPQYLNLEKGKQERSKIETGGASCTTKIVNIHTTKIFRNEKSLIKQVSD